MTSSLHPAIVRARLQLMLRHSYLASAVARYPIHQDSEEDWCPTLATDGYNIFVNSEFTSNLSEEETIAALAHEVLHCVLGHIDRRGPRERWTWNVAIDHATNLFLLDSGFVLPKGALHDFAFRGLTAEDIYDRLHRLTGVAGKTEKGGALEKRAFGEGFDRHVDPGDIEGHRYRGKDFPTEMERRRLRSHFSKELLSSLPGREAGMHSEEIARAGCAEIPWEAILTRFVNGLRQNDYRMFPFNKKHLWRGMLLPSVGAPGPDHLIVAIDTSSSMDHKTLSAVLSEIDKLRSLVDCSMTLIQCDAAIQAVKTYDAWETSSATFERFSFVGRGGTSLKPPFMWLYSECERRNTLPDALIYITDGYGDFPDRPPPIPCLWIVPQHSLKDFPFGEVLRIKTDRLARA